MSAGPELAGLAAAAIAYVIAGLCQGARALAVVFAVVAGQRVDLSPEVLPPGLQVVGAALRRLQELPDAPGVRVVCAVAAAVLGASLRWPACVYGAGHRARDAAAAVVVDGSGAVRGRARGRL